MATPIATFQENVYAATPAIDSMRKISSGEYATLDRASLANTGSAILLGSSVSCSCVLRSLRPSSTRLAESARPTWCDASACPPPDLPGCSVGVLASSSREGHCARRDDGVWPGRLDVGP